MALPQLSNILQAAYEVLKDAGQKGMSLDQITEAAMVQHRNMGLSLEDFRKKVASALAANLKLKSARPTFAPVNWDKGPRKGKPKQGWYRIRPVRNPLKIKPIVIPPVPNAFLGKAGEYAVMGELLFWGFNTSSMIVDDGVDVVANKEGKFFYIQVKTATRQDSGKYSFTIGQAAFKRYNASDVFYVFVMRGILSNEYIIVPSTHINFLIDTGVISDGSSLSLTITSDPKKTMYTLNGTDITPCYGNFGQIK